MDDLGMQAQWSNGGCLIIHRAGPGDVNGIWHLLHANCRTWTVPQIVQQLDRFFVLAIQRKMIGVLFGGLSPENKAVDGLRFIRYIPSKPYGN